MYCFSDVDYIYFHQLQRTKYMILVWIIINLRKQNNSQGNKQGLGLLLGNLLINYAHVAEVLGLSFQPTPLVYVMLVAHWVETEPDFPVSTGSLA